jgi:3-oxoacid CoA-transferase subunit A
MFYITGDTHGDFRRFEKFCEKFNTTEEDVMIILGDAGINYYGGKRDKLNKSFISDFPITFFCIHGNHEMRPLDIKTYKTKEFYGGTVWYEEEFPNILFAKDGEIYNLPTANGYKKCLVIGGAYSVDKFYRLAHGYAWFANEQPSDEIKSFVENQISDAKNSVDIVLTHTCPLKYEPIEVFLSFIDQSTVDKTTEEWLGKVEGTLNYEKWYCGHYHTEKTIDKLIFMFESIREF